MEEQLNPLAVTHLLQHTLRSMCIHQSSQWLYAVFWRILPRNYPPPRWDLVDGGVNIDRMRGNRRNWILAWEDGFCNFAASTSDQQSHECDPTKGLLQPELFFKMSHEIYNYGEGLIGKVAADHSHKWVFKEPQDHGINLLSTWINHADAQPRTWEAQFQSGIMTIALIAVREGVVQLGSMNKVVEDLSFIVQLREKFSYLESIPGVLLPHPSSSAFPADGCNAPADSAIEFYYHFAPQTSRIMPSMSSLEALLSKLPPVRPPPAPLGYMLAAPVLLEPQKDMERTAKEETEDEQERGILKELGGESSCTMPYMSTNN